MKDIVNKKGFTLTEIIVVIALIGILLLLVTPSLIKVFSNSINSTMKVQEKEIEDAALIYLEDYCKNRINNNICPNTISKNTDNKYSGYINLQTLINLKYIDDVAVQGTDCNGCIIYTNNKAKAYLTCDEAYTTKSDVDFKNICNIN